MVLAVVLFAVAAVLGLVLVTSLARGAPRPLVVIAAHGVFAAAGLAALIVAAVGGVPAAAQWALGVFVVAALGGFGLVALERTGRAVPLPFALGHGLAAVVAFALLLIAVVGGA